ncbi:uncharacterized protein M421DRAFT_68738 [Didymella exigua CBS 183.55]|uniref:Zn(2)-C6 fungal-type domain-containing protein n=1 Tax=Didymella exigua CBS 183.55 TaxID=1150837 RepID=A0A6A5RHN0_9PLEO|nr:uncharacterized protein M421DRAFT_68738 [Didymella exigua CBS 183.55]KAF1925966.1 hypothetical protein M421DRAFT_68738 [Didymella exigua CBS 183.55]
MPVTSSAAPKPRKPRPSRARGLRTTTGCLTCRSRRIKCDEQRPRCATCIKSDRECRYASPNDASTSTAPNGPTPSAQAMPSPALARKSITSDTPFSNSPELQFDSPLTTGSVASMPSPNSAPYEWYDLLAEDAIQNVAKYNLNLEVEKPRPSQRESPERDDSAFDPQLRSPDQDNDAHLGLPPILQDQWNLIDTIPLTDDELVLFQHYVGVVGPILDLCDPTRQFSTSVPRLAVHNLGLLKSLLAVAARHMAGLNQFPFLQTGSEPQIMNPLLNVATQYYYETLHYLSQNLNQGSYSKSREIISTALLISTYEMFDAEGQYNNGAWERHLRGIFWIQRSQNNNGECRDPLRRAAWWAWIRQDTWVAFREGRRVLTIWRPLRRLDDLTPDELCLRIIYICGRCVDFAATESVKKYDVDTRIEQGKKLTQALNDWYNILGSSFQPIYRPALPAQDTLFPPIWIHPPSHAAAMQTYHVSRIIVAINEPSPGGMEDMRHRQRLLDESVDTVCGIASTHQGREIPSAMSNVRALYTAGLAARDPVKQAGILQLLEETLEVTKFPPRSLVHDLTTHWRAQQ